MTKAVNELCWGCNQRPIKEHGYCEICSLQKELEICQPAEKQILNFLVMLTALLGIGGCIFILWVFTKVGEGK